MVWIFVLCLYIRSMRSVVNTFPDAFDCENSIILCICKGDERKMRLEHHDFDVYQILKEKDPMFINELWLIDDYNPFELIDALKEEVL